MGASLTAAVGVPPDVVGGAVAVGGLAEAITTLSHLSEPAPAPAIGLASQTVLRSQSGDRK